MYMAGGELCDFWMGLNLSKFPEGVKYLEVPLFLSRRKKKILPI